MPRNIPIIADENIYPHPPIDNVDDEYYESIVCLWDSTSLCVEEKFISGNTSDMECYGEGDPVVVVPRNWPPRDWNGANPRKAIIYLDDLIDFEYDSQENVIELYETELKRDERIMRYLNVSLDKDANDWAIKRRKKLKKEKV